MILMPGGARPSGRFKQSLVVVEPDASDAHQCGGNARETTGEHERPERLIAPPAVGHLSEVLAICPRGAALVFLAEL